MRGDTQSPLEGSGVTESHLRGDRESPEGCLCGVQSIYEVDTKSARRAALDGRAAARSINEHTQAVEHIVEWAYLVADGGITQYRRAP
jgi:hypothetical protein